MSTVPKFYLLHLLFGLFQAGLLTRGTYTQFWLSVTTLTTQEVLSMICSFPPFFFGGV